MASFKGKDGKEWLIELNYGLVLDAKNKAGVPLGELLDPSNRERLSQLVFGASQESLESLGKLLWHLVEKQAVAAGVAADEFAYSLNWESIEGARVAVAEAIADFRQGRETGRAVRESLPAMIRKADQMAAAEIKRVTTDILGQNA